MEGKSTDSAHAETNGDGQPRSEAPGSWHHVMEGGIQWTKLFHVAAERADLVTWLAVLGQSPKRMLTGYVVNFTRLHIRNDRLFQNR